MAFALKPTVSVLIPSATGALMDFTSTQSVQDLWICNTHSAKITVSIYFDYNGTSATTTEQFLNSYEIDKGAVLHLTGIWVFENGGRISGACSTNNGATIHISKADV